MTVDPAQLRTVLDATGHLATRRDDDPGYVSGYWREQILALCDALDNQEPVEPEPDSLREAEALLTRVQASLFGGLPAERLVRAHYLIEQALPRMRSLNNAMSPTWVRLAEEYLAGPSS